LRSSYHQDGKSACQLDFQISKFGRLLGISKINATGYSTLFLLSHGSPQINLLYYHKYPEELPMERFGKEAEMGIGFLGKSV